MEMYYALQQSLLSVDSMDVARWILDDVHDFPIANFYNIIVIRNIPFGPFDRFDKASVMVWKTEVQVKIRVFRWRFFQNILPTIRGIFSYSNSLCVFCNSCVESSLHFFLLCHNLEGSGIFYWVGI